MASTPLCRALAQTRGGRPRGNSRRVAQDPGGGPLAVLRPSDGAEERGPSEEVFAGGRKKLRYTGGQVFRAWTRSYTLQFLLRLLRPFKSTGASVWSASHRNGMLRAPLRLGKRWRCPTFWHGTIRG